MSTRKTLCFTGMGSQEEAQLKALFDTANAQVGKLWELAALESAEVLVIDVDSIYGHMTWLREHNGPRRIVALTSGERAEADHILRQPVKAESFAQLLRELAAAEPRSARVTAEAPAAPSGPPAPAAAPREPVAPPQPQSPPPPAEVMPRTDSPAPTHPGPAPVAATPTRPAPASAPSAAQPAAPIAPSAKDPEPVPEPAPPAREPHLADHLRPGALPGPVKLALDAAPVLVLDPKSQTYLGPAPLKPFSPYCQRVIRSEDWSAVTPGEFEKLKVELGGAQPFGRLLWLCGLLAGRGHIAEGYDPNQRYRLLKWPQIEREFPKHFRIATVMMKGPQSLTEIAEGAGVPLTEVSDFVNANLFSGQAEMEQPVPPPDPGAAAKSGLFGRFRPK